LWALAVASWTTDVAGFGQDQINQRLLDSKISDLRYYNAEIHHALLALPGFLRRALS
jgi:spermidine synthase